MQVRVHQHPEVSYRFSMLAAWCSLYLVGYGVGWRDLKLAYGVAFFLSLIGTLAVGYFFTNPPPYVRARLLFLACMVLAWGGITWRYLGMQSEFAAMIPALTTVATLLLIWLGGPGRMPFVLLLALMAIGTGLVVLHRFTWPSLPGAALNQLGWVWGLTFSGGLGASLVSRAMTPTVAA